MTSRTSRAQQNRKRKQLARALALSACLISAAAPAIAKTIHVSTADELYKATLVSEGAAAGNKIVLDNDIALHYRQTKITENDLAIHGSPEGTKLVPASGHGENALIQLHTQSGGSTLLSNLAIHGNGPPEEGSRGISISATSSSTSGYTLNLTSVTFAGNARGAIYSGVPLTINITDAEDGTQFIENRSDSGGAIRVKPALRTSTSLKITTYSDAPLTFRGNTADLNGGALCVENGDMVLNVQGPVVASHNYANGSTLFNIGGGGAFYAGDNILLSGNNSAIFTDNFATENGGALGAFYDVNLDFKGPIVFKRNTAHRLGGAIAGVNSVKLSSRSSILFDENNAIQGSGAIYTLGSITLNASDDLIFKTIWDSMYADDDIFIKAGTLRTAANLNFTAEGSQGITIQSGTTFFPSVSSSGGLKITGIAMLESGLKLVVTDHSAESVHEFYTVRSADFLTVTGGLSVSENVSSGDPPLFIGSDSNFNFTNISTDYRSGDITSRDVNGSTVLTLSRTNRILTYAGPRNSQDTQYWTLTRHPSTEAYWNVTNSSGITTDSWDHFYIGDDMRFGNPFSDDPDHRINRNVIVSGSVYPCSMNVSYGDADKVDFYTFRAASGGGTIDAQSIDVAPNVKVMFEENLKVVATDLTANKGAQIWTYGTDFRLDTLSLDICAGVYADNKSHFLADNLWLGENAHIYGGIWNVEKLYTSTNALVSGSLLGKASLTAQQVVTGAGTQFNYADLKTQYFFAADDVTFSGANITADSFIHTSGDALFTASSAFLGYVASSRMTLNDTSTVTLTGGSTAENSTQVENLTLSDAKSVLKVQGTATFNSVTGSGRMEALNSAQVAFNDSVSMGSYTAKRNSITALAPGVRLSSSELKFEANSTLAIKASAYTADRWALGPQSATIPAKLTVDRSAVLSLTDAALDQYYKILLKGFTNYGAVANWRIAADVEEYAEAEWNISNEAGLLRLKSKLSSAALPSGSVVAQRAVQNFTNQMNSRITEWLGNDGLNVLGIKRFLPAPASAKKSAVWAAMNYNRDRIDGLKIGDKKQDMDISYYGATIGFDRPLGGGVAGLALDVGTFKGDGKGEWSASSSDGKFIGLGLYGAKKYGAWTLSALAAHHWIKSDMENSRGSNHFSADGVKSRVFSAGLRAGYNGLQNLGSTKLTPFAGVEFSHYSEDGYDTLRNGDRVFRTSSESLNQWRFALGMRADWRLMETRSGWRTGLSAEMAYVRAAGDVDYGTWVSGAASGTEMLSYRTAVADRDSVRASLSVEARRKNFTAGLRLGGQFSSGQRSLGVSLTGRWEL